LTALQQQLGDSHRLVFGFPKTNSHGSAWFVPRQSRLTIAGAEIMHLPSFSDRPLLKGTLMHQGHPIDLLLFHAIRPRHEASVAFQRQEFSALANWSRTADRDLIVFGDFNSTPWHGPFRQMLAISGLRNSQLGFGWQTTWPSPLPPPLRLAIDHSLHSPRITTLGREVGPDIGSDHLPLMLEFGLP
jgi:endonuclease/exonuclease/phosphatase (EEP) superfamily protein YafD